jgi:hypothetical protein
VITYEPAGFSCSGMGGLSTLGVLRGAVIGLCDKQGAVVATVGLLDYYMAFLTGACGGINTKQLGFVKLFWQWSVSC